MVKENKNILFVLGRHGRTSGNENNVYRGHSNAEFAQLDAGGRNDAREEGIFLQGTGLVFPLIITDDLDRTFETAQIIASILGIKPENIMRDKRLRPLDMGDWTGKKKDEHPLDSFMKDKSKKIPGGDSLNSLNKRQSAAFADVLETVAKLHAPVLVIGHGTNAGFLHSHVNKSSEEIGYEGLTHPGGVSIFTKEGITPVYKKREGAPQLFKDGTEVSGFVTDEENRPPRECWNCRNFVSVNGLGACTHTLVLIDPKLADRRQADGNVAVGERDCCDNFRNKIGT
jgi:broad specificity phosphatase PhoE